VIEPEDLMFSDTATNPSKFVTSESTAHSVVSKLKALESAPVIGAFDANHLQEIHAHIFRDALSRPGQLRLPRPSSLSSSLDSLFDRLARENRLKGLELDAWSKRATDYLREIERLSPFDEGSGLTSIEFFRELATENGLTLRWSHTLNQPAIDELQVQVQAIQSDNLRRLLILAVDPDLSKPKSIPVRNRHYSLDLFRLP
jgi:fido (protein-threonine AMPylation protein)